MTKYKIFRKYFPSFGSLTPHPCGTTELLTGSPQDEAHGSAEYLFKCTEKEGFYSVSEPVSEDYRYSI